MLLPFTSQGGHFDEEGITGLLLAPGRGGDPGISGTRNLQDNLSDLKAQVGPEIGIMNGVLLQQPAERPERPEGASVSSLPGCALLPCSTATAAQLERFQRAGGRTAGALVLPWLFY